MNFSCFVSAPRLLLGAALCGLTATVSSAAPVQFGVLACNVEPGGGLIIGSSKSISCVFHPWHRRPEYYTGTISRIGLDLGGTGPGHLAWGVVTAGPPSRFALAGNYTGPGAGFALGDGFSPTSPTDGVGRCQAAEILGMQH